MRRLLLLCIIFFPINVFAIGAEAVTVMDVNSGRVLYEKNSNSKHLIASTTKIMTCIIVLENADIEEKITVGEEVLDMYGTNIYIEPNETIMIKDLLYGLMLRSGNDAAITLAVNTIGEEKFINKMNSKAKELGMNNTLFQNPHGLDDKSENTSTAYDMALLAKYAYSNKIYRKIVSTKKYTAKSSLKSYTWYNRMSLLNKYKNCIGGKNGYTPKAGKSLVSYAKKGDLILTIVTLDDNDIYDNHINMYNEYLDKYKNYLLLSKSSFKIDSNFENREFYIKKDFYYPLREDELDEVKTILELYSKARGKTAGNIVIKNGNERIGKVKIYKKESKKKEDINIFKKILKLFVR